MESWVQSWRPRTTVFCETHPCSRSSSTIPRRHAKPRPNLKQCTAHRQIFILVTSKCASCPSDVHFFNSWKVLREWRAFSMLAAKCASRHGNMQFSTTRLPKVLRAGGVFNNSWSLICLDVSAPAALASLLVDPLEPQNVGKHTMLRDFFYLFDFGAPESSFYWLFLFWLFCSLTALTTVDASVHRLEIWLLNFLWQVIVQATYQFVKRNPRVPIHVT